MELKFRKPGGVTYANVMLYGPPKTGKTAGACTAPGGKLLLNADLPNATRYAHSKDPDGSILEVVMPRWEEGNRDQIMDLLGEVARVAYQEPRIVDTVIVDPIGELHRRLMEDLSGRAVRPRIDFYGDAAMQIERWSRFMCEAPVNFIIVAHEHSVGEGENVEKVAFTGTKGGSETLSQKLMGMVDIIGYTSIIEVEGKREAVAQIVQGNGRQGGDRFDVLGAERPFRVVNLEEWFELAGVHMGESEQKKEAISA